MDKLLKELMASGLTQQEIVSSIVSNGVKTNQSSISKIKNGIYKNYSYELGAAIVALHRQICVTKGRKK